MVICLKQIASDLQMVCLALLSPHNFLLYQNSHWFTFLVPAYPSCSKKEAIKWMSVCLSVFCKLGQVE